MAPHLIGEPFTLQRAWVEANVTLVCNCGGGHQIEIVASQPSDCPLCGTRYNAKYDLTTQRLVMQIAKPQPTTVS